MKHAINNAINDARKANSKMKEAQAQQKAAELKEQKTRERLLATENELNKAREVIQYV